MNGSKISIPLGGQVSPNSKLGDDLEWKNIQKKAIKKKISEVINRLIPHFNPIVTCWVWSPWKVLSRDTSRHHTYIVNKIINVPKRIILIVLKWKNLVVPVNKISILKELIRGHGL